ncbi:outer membrane protein assembly factor BamB family protein [Geodermatophilus nigrescens]
MALRPPPLRVWIWTAGTLVLALVAVLLYRGSSVAATDSTTAPASPLPGGTPAGQVAQAWSADGQGLPVQLVQEGRVVVPRESGLVAHDAVSGEEAWHYRRDDAELCGATAVDGLVVAVFRTAGRCDEALALDAATGVRQWTRNLSLRGDATIQGTSQAVLASSATGVVVIDPTGDNVRWRTAADEGCRLTDTAVGSSGVALLQRCPGSDAVRLRLFDSFTGQARWSRDVAVPDGGEVTLVGADRLVTVAAGGTLLASRPDDGSEAAALPLPEGDGDGDGDGGLLQGGAGDLALLWARGTLWAVDPATGEVRWERPARGLPATADAAKTAAGDVAVWVPEEGGFVLRDLATGEEAGRADVDGGLEPGGRTSVTGAALVYRLEDRVLGYR